MIRAWAKQLPFASRMAGIAGRAYRRLTAPRPVILMYHRVAEESFDPWNLAVSPANFADQMQWLARRRTVLPLSEFAQRHRDSILPADAVAITFDDGYACNAKSAAPVLNDLGLAATIFLPGELIERGRPFWWDELQDLLLDHPGASVRLNGESVDLGERQDDDHRWPRDQAQLTPRQRRFYNIWSRLQPLPAAEIEKAMAELREQAPGATDSESHRLMTAKEARAIQSGTIEFGSHSMTHASLPNLSSTGKAREIRESVRACERVTGNAPLTFAYPFGQFDSESERIVEDSGFACACTTEGRSVRRADSAFSLPRIQVGDWNAAQLRKALRIL